MTRHLIDVVVPLGPNDVCVFPAVLAGIRNHISDVRNIYIVSATKPASEFPIVYVDEGDFPFKLEQIKSDFKFGERAGWYFQQLLKLYFQTVVPSALDNILIVDADTVFLRDVSFVIDGRPCFGLSSEFHRPYFEHMNRLNPAFRKAILHSGIVHCMMFNRRWLSDLMLSVEAIHRRPFWEIFLKKISRADRMKSGASEYEMYFNFCLQNHKDEIIIRNLSWKNAASISDKDGEYFDYVSIHWYQRYQNPDVALAASN